MSHFILLFEIRAYTLASVEWLLEISTPAITCNIENIQKQSKTFIVRVSYCVAMVRKTRKGITAGPPSRLAYRGNVALCPMPPPAFAPSPTTNSAQFFGVVLAAEGTGDDGEGSAHLKVPTAGHPTGRLLRRRLHCIVEFCYMCSTSCWSLFRATLTKAMPHMMLQTHPTTKGAVMACSSDASSA